MEKVDETGSVGRLTGRSITGKTVITGMKSKHRKRNRGIAQ